LTGVRWQLLAAMIVARQARNHNAAARKCGRASRKDIVLGRGRTDMAASGQTCGLHVHGTPPVAPRGGECSSERAAHAARRAATIGEADKASKGGKSTPIGWKLFEFAPNFGLIRRDGLAIGQRNDEK